MGKEPWAGWWETSSDESHAHSARLSIAWEVSPSPACRFLLGAVGTIMATAFHCHMQPGERDTKGNIGDPEPASV